MKRLFFVITLMVSAMMGQAAARQLPLDSCRALALRNNKALAMERSAVQKAYYDRKAAHTNYLPKVSAMGGYMRTGDEISLLSRGQKDALSNMGTALTGKFGELAGQIIKDHPELAPLIGQIGGYLPQVGDALNGVGQGIADALRTDTRNVTTAAVILTQPLYMGGKIRAYDRITRHSKK